MEHSVRYVYELRLKIQLIERKGTAFQKLFEDIMVCHSGDDFLKVRPHGQDGDWACDGLCRSKRQLFQVYAPQDKLSAKEAIAKIDHDFDRAVEQWGDRFSTWVFVHNDPNGLPPRVAQHLMDLEGRDGKDILIWDPGILKSMIFDRPDRDFASLLGPPCSAGELGNFGAEHIQQVVSHIALQGSDSQEEPLEVPPGKLEFNQLSDSAAHLIRSHLVKAPRVSRYFAGHGDPTLRDQVATALHVRYKALRSTGMEADRIFTELCIFIAGTSSRQEPAMEGATLAVLAHFFESCDIFEAPDLMARIP